MYKASLLTLLLLNQLQATNIKLFKESNQTFTTIILDKTTKKDTITGVTFKNAYEYLDALKTTNATTLLIDSYDKNGHKIKSIKKTLHQDIELKNSIKNKNFITLGKNSLLFFNQNEQVEKTLNFELIEPSLISSENGIFLTTKQKHNPQDMFGSSGGYTVYKLDNLATTIWQKNLNTKESLVEAKALKDGSLLVLLQNSLYIVNGEKTQLLAPAKGYKVVELNSGELLVLARDKNDNLEFIKISRSGKTLLKNTIETEYKSYINDIVELNDGSFMTAGSVVDKDDKDALVMKLDSELNLVDQEHFGDKWHDSFYEIKQVANGSFLCVGEKTDAKTKQPTPWVAKVDKELNLY